MLKSRNAFFSESAASQTFIPNNQPYPYQNNSPYTQSAQQSFYAGPTNQVNPNQYNYQEDIDNRIAKIERQINRLDSRITKLENTKNIISDEVSSSMYMV